ncbi:hypothetical protein HY045_01855 [Candidatus Woesebacteria bacterium]|nr:hypothetical protein [Candidatus Woesebacteria bacterium]
MCEHDTRKLIQKAGVVCPWAISPLNGDETDIVHCIKKIQVGDPDHLCVSVKKSSKCPEGPKMKKTVVEIGMKHIQQRGSVKRTIDVKQLGP